MKRILIYILFLLLQATAYAQVQYPIRSFTQITPPVPYSLSGFVSQEGRMVLNINVDDVSLDNYPVKFRLHIEGNGIKIYTNPTSFQDAYYLNGAENIRLSGFELEYLFSPRNLIFEGYSKAVYQRRGRLPEGVYRVWVDVVDYYRGFKVSQAIPAVAMIYLTRAPRLSFPANNTEINISEQSNIRFSWLATMASDPLADVVYQFRLYEIRPQGRDPYEVAENFTPIFEYQGKETSFVYDIGMPPLNIGKDYAWRIRAVDLENRVLFKNKGLSDVFSFRYGCSCNTPYAIIDKVEDNSIHISWNDNPLASVYSINYKKNKDSIWQQKETTNNPYVLDNLKGNAKYQIRVLAHCGDQESEYSKILDAKTKREINYACGAKSDEFDLSNTNPLTRLGRFDEFMAADFFIEVEQAEGANGMFSGTGYALVPYLGSIKYKLTFDNIFINDDKRMIRGQVDFVYDKATGTVFRPGGGDDDTSQTDYEENHSVDEIADKVIIIEGEIKKLEVNGQTVTITKTDGSTETVRVEKGKKLGVISSDGDKVYVADTSSGNIYTSSKKASAGTAKVGSASQTGDYGCGISFLKSKTQAYGFDSPNKENDKYKKPISYFKKDKNNLSIAWKSLEEGRQDFVDLNVLGNCSADSLRYLRNSGMLSPITKQGRYHKLMLTGLGDQEEDLLIAAKVKTVIQKDSSKREILTEVGSLGLVSYERISRKVILVPVNGAQCPQNAQYIKDELNRIYAPAIVSWSVKLAAPLHVDNLQANGFGSSEMNAFSRYTPNMRKLTRAFKKTGQKEKHTLVLFFIKDPSVDFTGFMPLSSDFGFIFNFGSESEVLAHELAHGAFNLRHTFSTKAKYPLAEKTTRNLMDYNKSSELWKYQWDRIHNPESIFFSAYDEDEGAEVGDNYYTTIKNKRICHSETLDGILLQGKNRFSFRSPADINNEKDNSLFSISIDNDLNYDLYYFEHDDRKRIPYRGSIAIIKNKGKKYAAKFKGTVSDFSFKAYSNTINGLSDIMYMDKVLTTKSSVQLPFVKKHKDGQYYYRIVSLNDLGSDDTDDKYKLLDDCHCYDQKDNELEKSNNNEIIITQGELQKINDLLKVKSSDPNPIQNVYYIENESEAIEIMHSLSGDAEALAIDNTHKISYLLKAGQINKLNTTPDAFAMAFGLMKEQSIATMKLMIEFNQLLLNKLKIPSKYWDLQHKQYSAKHYKLFKILGYSTNEFAFYCGIYEGVLETVGDFTGVLNVFVATETPGSIKKMFTSLPDFKAIKDVIVKAHSTENISVFNHQLGLDVVYVVTFVYSVKDMPKAVSEIARTTNKNLKFISKKACKSFNKLSETIKQTLRKTPDGFIVEVLEDNTILFLKKNKVIATRTPAGTLFSGDIRNLEPTKTPKIDVDIEGDDFWDELAEYGDGGGVDDPKKLVNTVADVVDLALIQKIKGKFPVNSVEFAGFKFDFNLLKNKRMKDIVQKRWKSQGLTDVEILVKRNEFDLLFKKYPNGVSFNKKGFPEFSKYRHKDVPFEVDIGKLNLDPLKGVGGSTGSQLDMKAVRDAMKNITGNPKWTKPKGYTWHHIENTTKLELVPTDLHNAIRHSGGRSTYKF